MLSIFVLGSLLTWRIARLVSIETGPFSLLARFRTAVGVYNSPSLRRAGKNEFAKMILCMKCLSIWVGWAVALGYYIVQGLVPITLGIPEGLVLSAGAIILDMLYDLATKALNEK